MGEPMRPSVAVLIVEDEPLIRMGTVYLIEDAGFEVYEAGSADAAIALLELHREIRLILTDVDMPGSRCDKDNQTLATLTNTHNHTTSHIQQKSKPKHHKTTQSTNKTTTKTHIYKPASLLYTRIYSQPSSSIGYRRQRKASARVENPRADRRRTWQETTRLAK